MEIPRDAAGLAQLRARMARRFPVEEFNAARRRACPRARRLSCASRARDAWAELWLSSLQLLRARRLTCAFPRTDCASGSWIRRVSWPTNTSTRSSRSRAVLLRRRGRRRRRRGPRRRRRRRRRNSGAEWSSWRARSPATTRRPHREWAAAAHACLRASSTDGMRVSEAKGVTSG